ncbi:hypothetical protein F7731_18930 [Cytobacillus depressus]|uniref:YheE family protein n=1 Tax=Cytobacillus depressus TaxID=1602942 RepID=A0A6L3V2Y4_9BACI|nr:DUF5342 family protein [Cytobacillus depressus]KAB2331153.1 hypothetical protein F7731_18930 [Cytobacillus depressus]
MVKNFNVNKKLFKGQFHERHTFSVNFQGNEYQGIYHNGKISWFNPQPINHIKEKYLAIMESIVHKKMCYR